MKTSTLKKLCILARSGISFALYHVDRITCKGSPFVIVLNYHSISADNWFHSINLSTLKEQILTLKRLGFEFITLETLSSIITGKIIVTKPSVVITFDDGYKNILSTRAFFKKLGIKPAVFLLSDTTRVKRDELDNHEAFLSRRDILSLVLSGWYVGSHGETHARLDSLKNSEVYKEIVFSKKRLENNLKKKIHYFAYPKGRYNKRILTLVRESKFKLAFTMDDGLITKSTNSLRIPRIGINRSHTISEFTTLWSPSVMASRRLIKGFIRM